MDINRLKKLAGFTLTESTGISERSVREVTNQIYEAIDEGLIDPMTVVDACLTFMSEDDVAEMARVNDFFMDNEEDFE